MNEIERYPVISAEESPSVASETNERSRGEQFSVDLDTSNAVIEAMLSSSEVDHSGIREAWMVRADLIESFIDSLEPTSEDPGRRVRVQFDVIVDKAMIFERAGNMLRYLIELDTAEGFALEHRLDEVIGSLSQEIDDKAIDLDDSLDALVIKLRGNLCFANREYLRDLIQDGDSAEDVLDAIYGMIIDEGGDPDEVLALLGITER